MSDKKVLQCHSQGDKRFSPFFCYLNYNGRRDTIENFYHQAKVFEGQRRPKNWHEAKAWQEEGVKLEGWIIDGLYLTARKNKDGSLKINDFGVQFYIKLWYKYLTLNPELIEYASQYDKFEDIFAGKFPFCQARVIEKAVREGVDSLCSMYEELEIELDRILL